MAQPQETLWRCMPWGEEPSDDRNLQVEQLRICIVFFFTICIHSSFHSQNNKKQQQENIWHQLKKRWNPSISTWTHLTTPCLSGVVSVPWSSQGAAVRCLAYVVPRCWEYAVSQIAGKGEIWCMNVYLQYVPKNIYICVYILYTYIYMCIYIYTCFFPSDFTYIKCKFIW